MAAYPDLLNRYLVAKIQMAVYKASPLLLFASRSTPETLAPATTVTPNENCVKDIGHPTIRGGHCPDTQDRRELLGGRASEIDTEETESKLAKCRLRFSEHIIWTEPLRGTIPLTEYEIANNLAIGGLGNTADSVSRLQTVGRSIYS